MEFVFFIIVLLVSVLAEGIIGVRFNMAGIGSIVGGCPPLFCVIVFNTQ